jgi:transcriptional regulator with XRE-family HTH domain
MSFGQRLREERRRLGLSQVQCAELCGVVEKTQGLYETSVRRPDTDYLAAFAKAGADVNYLITGALSSTILSEEELTLLSLFRQSDAAVREIILGTASVAAQTSQAGPRASRHTAGPATPTGASSESKTSTPRK